MATRECRVSGIAKQLGMHERTLNRRLREEGSTFRQELREIRFSIAKHLLADTNMPLSKIAEVLDYSDETAFSRAFKRWSASTPTEWRARCQQT
jgi:AraC-like DNA-binding protein